MPIARGRGLCRGRRGVVALLLLAALLPAAAPTQEDVVPLSAEEVRNRWQSRLDNRHFVARVRMQMYLGGLIEERRMTVIRDDVDRQQERVMIRFDAPEDFRGLGLLYLEHAGQPNDYFIYQPATRRIRRLPSTVVDDDIYGIDPEFLGFGVAEGEPTEIRSMTAEELHGRPTYRLEERALEQNPRFEERTTWVDAESFVPLRTEYRRRDKLALVAETKSVSTIQGVVTPLEMYFENAIEDRKVTLLIDGVEYEKEIPDTYFSMLNLLKSRFSLP